MSEIDDMRFKIHNYDHIKCSSPHDSFMSDFTHLCSSSFTERKIFCNLHTALYLKAFCEKTPVIDEYLQIINYKGSTKATMAIMNYFKNRKEGD